MPQQLVLLIVQFGFLVLLWLCVLAAVRVVRTDLFAVRPARARAAAPPPSTAARAEPRLPDRRSAARRLFVTAGALAGTSLTLGDSPVTLGRSDDSTLVLSDDYASSHHARLVPGDGTWLVEDLGSTNGTYLGATKVTGPIPVPLGEPIRIGKTVLELRR